MPLRALVLALPALFLWGGPDVPGLRLELEFSKKAYTLGETIDVTMRYRYAGRKKLTISHITYDRSGRVYEFGFTATDEQDRPVADPIRDMLGGLMGGERDALPLVAGEPFEQIVQLNEWLRFDRPGRYRITAQSQIVECHLEGVNDSASETVHLKSAPIEIEILPPDEAKRLTRLARARGALTRGDYDVHAAAARDLRFMIDERAIPLLLWTIANSDVHAQQEAHFGLAMFPNMTPVKAAVLQRVKERGRNITIDEVDWYTEILAGADVRLAGLRGGEQHPEWWTTYHSAQLRWQTFLTPKLRQGIAGRPPHDVARILVDRMAEDVCVPPDDLETWKFVFRLLRSIQSTPSAGRAVALIKGLRLPELLPDLRRLAGSVMYRKQLRSAAIVALDALGDESMRELVFRDLCSRERRLTTEAHATLGSYRARDVADSLLTEFLESEGAQREEAAGRILNLGGALTATELRGLLAVTTDPGASDRWPIVLALAIVSPEDVVPILTAFLDNSECRRLKVWRQHLELLTRIDTPRSQMLLRSLLVSSVAEDRLQIVRELRRTNRAPGKIGKPDGAHLRSPRARVADRFVPELLLLARRDRSMEVRHEATRALAEITGIPEGGLGLASDATVADCLSLWGTWWERNGARHGRWGRVHHGIAILVSSVKGEFEPGEDVSFTVRIRRQKGEVLLRNQLVVRVLHAPDDLPEADEWANGRTITVPIQAAKPLGLEPGSEVVVEVGVKQGRVSTRPGLNLVRLRLEFEPQDWERGSQVVDPVTSHALDIWIRVTEK